MSVFPQLGIINEAVTKTINGRIGNNVDVSKLIPWLRVASAGVGSNEKFTTIKTQSGESSVRSGGDVKASNGLILESLPVKNSFSDIYGGIIDKEKKSGRVGVDFSGANVYADGADRTHRPSPIIESMNIENGNKGLSKKASFSITCYTLAQAETISQYFLEPGFVVLVEFGYNLQESITQKAELGNDGPCEIARYNNYEYVLNKRIASGGTYDGFMGYITDGGMTNGENETYIIDVTLTTLGEIPAYLQMHKNGSTSEIGDDNKLTKAKAPNKFYTSDIDSNAKGDSYGMALFMQMYNRLPAEKQTIGVKNLWKANDINGNSYTLPGNYINMDDVVREKIGKLAGDDFNAGDGGEITIPDGLNFITNQSFIRMELAFEIINKYAVGIDTTESKCSGAKPFNFKINAQDTVCRAHKNIFSTDLSKVYIPNSQLPEFGLANAFAKEPVEVFIDVNNITTINGCFFEGNEDKYAFPSTVDYIDSDLMDTTPASATAHTWGYLRNLYINFDFFLEVISGTNLVAKDVYYEILNGVSAAVNSYWEFDLFMTPRNPPAISNSDTTTPSWQPQNQAIYGDTTKSSPIDGGGNKGSHPYELSVRDTSFSGNVSKKEKMTEWTMSGINTPFLSSKMDISIPAMMRNHTLGLRSSAKVQNQIEGNPQKYLFAQGEDRVLTILNSFKIIPEEDESKGKPKDDDIQKANLDLFLSRALMLPKIQTRDSKVGERWWGKNQEITKIFLIAGWNDSVLLNDVRMINEHMSKPTDGTISNPAILSIGFDFDVIGVSGIKVGDIFKIQDLPKQFKEHGVFQVMDISHALSNGTWTTSVKSKMRNI